MVRQRDSGQIFAMKMLHKWEMLKRAEVSVGSDGTCTPYEWVGGEGVLPVGRAGHAGEGAGLAPGTGEDPTTNLPCCFPTTSLS